MKSFLTFVLGVGIGVGVGVATSWVYHKNKYEEMVQEEIESLRDVKNKKDKKVDSQDKVEYKLYVEDRCVDNISKENLKQAKNIIDYNGYSKIEHNEDIISKNPLFVITPDEFASQLGYDTDTFYLFEDDIITNDNNEVVYNVKETFGLTVEEIRCQFGVYEDDAVYIRNQKISTDYEILRDLDNYEKRNGE